MGTDDLQWDSSSMKWRKDRAPSFHEDSLPSPLYIFGYGSLIWRPALLEQFSSFRANAVGHRRVFAQRSCDHRGTCEFPGLVLNLVTSDLLVSKGYRFDEDNNDSLDCHGLVWLIPQEKVPEVLEYLDDRECGGYDRHLLSVILTENTPHHEVNTSVQALAYVGHPRNPNFYLPPVKDDILEVSRVEHSQFQFRSTAADIIAAAKGSSGPNVEYLLRLQHFLNECGMTDDYINDLSKAVRQRIGVWRRKAFSEALALDVQNVPVHLAGWGSNEQNQLIATTPRGFDKNERNKMTPKNTWVSTLPYTVPWKEIEHFHVIAGGSSSALVRENSLTIWGKLVSDILLNYCPSLGAAAQTVRSIQIEGVHGAVMGHNHILLLLDSGAVVGFGDNRSGQCDPPCSLGLSSRVVTLQSLHTSEGTHVVKVKYDEAFKPLYRVAKLAAGPHHSAAITLCGGLLTWGENAYGQSIHSELPWHPDLESKLVDVGCGAKQTFVIDDLGRVFSMGSNEYGSLGRSIPSSNDHLVDENMRQLMFPSSTKFQRICCGLSHSVVRGILPSGELVFYGWGRSDLNQFATENETSGVDEDYNPKKLAKLPVANAHVLEVWCGPEYTIAMDDQGGHLWGIGPKALCDSNVVDPSVWRQVQQISSNSQEKVPPTVHLWEGSVACGDSHVICIVK